MTTKTTILLSRSLLFTRPTTTTKTLLSSFLHRHLSAAAGTTPTTGAASLLRPLSAFTATFRRPQIISLSPRSFATRATTSSLKDSNANWSNRPPKETILLDGCDFEHWLVVMEKPEGDPTRDEIIDSYIKTLAQVVGSEEEARMKIYSVSTRCYYAFGALVSEELSYKLKELPRVRWVLPDSYLDVRNKDYGGEPFINGQAVPYDPKYHEEWIRNNNRANERNRRNDRPRPADRSRSFERRRENMQRPQGVPSGPPPPLPNNAVPQGGPGTPPPPPNMGPMPPNNMGGPGIPPPPSNNYYGGPQHGVGMPHTNVPGAPPPPSNNYYGGPQNGGGMPPNMGGPGGPPPPPNYYGGPQNMGGMRQSNMGGVPPNGGWSNKMHGDVQHDFQNGPPGRTGNPYA